MDYETKYEKALEKAKVVYHDHRKDKYWRDWLTELFPELEEIESEDERIRKAIIAYISHGQHCGVSNADMIAWLENQNKTLNAELLTKVLRKHLYTCINKTNTYVRSEEDHISLTELIDKIKADLNIE